MPIDVQTDTALIRADGATSRPSGSGLRLSGTLPPDLLAEAVRRLRAVALLYALAYFLAGFFPALLLPEARAVLLSDPAHWLPGTLSIAAAVGLAALTWGGGLSDQAILRLGLLFEVLGSFGIAAAEYHGISGTIEYATGTGGFGLSWVAAWVMLFSVVVPAPTRVALLAAVASVSAVPLTYATGVALGSNTPLPPGPFFFSLVFPYLIIVIMAYVGSRVVSQLGAAVRRAREMGSYRLVERLGEGGMGEVWRAEHRMLARPAAIKLIRPEVLGAGHAENRRVLIRRFEREAQATALMRSPHTLELYDFGVADDGTFYYVMELLDGFDLDRLVDRFGPLPAERVVHLLRQACNSLGEAHEAGLIHRDIKPANIYTCRYGRAVDFVKVLDFGLVKRDRAPGQGTEKLTADHATGGTPAYMSPEQVLGDSAVDGRSDLYALGCVAYWLLTGTLVFKGRTPMETMVMHVHQTPDPPSARAGLPVSRELEAIVLDCLAKDAARRPRSADELHARLETVPLEHPWTDDRARQWWEAHQPTGPTTRAVA